MATGVTTDTFSEQSYLTVQEYKNAPTSIDYDNLVVGGNATAQDAELKNVILRASSYMDEYLNQNVVANRATETQRVRLNNSGYIALHPNQSPIISLESFYYGGAPTNLIPVNDPSQCWFEEQQIIIPLSQMATTWSSQGPLAFGAGIGGSNQIFAKYTYVAGFANTTVVSGTAGASTIVVADPIGIIPGEMLRISDGASSETVYVSSTYTYGSATITLVSPLVYTHAAGAAIGNMPNAIKQACILITTAFIKIRGDNSLTMNITTQPQGSIPGSARYGGEISMALSMVDKYRRIR
jgi:hypothetical protein